MRGGRGILKIAFICSAAASPATWRQSGHVLEAALAARERADLHPPELALCGVAPGHYLRAVDFAEGCRTALRNLAEALKDGPPLLVGAPVPSVYAAGLLSNAGVLVDKGQWFVVRRARFI